MLNLWQLPTQVTLEGKTYHLHTDYRDILEILTYLQDPDLPEAVRWRIAMALFYEETVPEETWQAAFAYLAEFLRCGQPEQPGPRLMDWEHDAPAILAGINRVAGQEIRALPYVHWWSFMSWFHAMEPGQFSTLVSIRDRMRRGKPLEPWQQEFYRADPRAVELPQRLNYQQRQQRAALLARLGDLPEEGGDHGK